MTGITSTGEKAANKRKLSTSLEAPADQGDAKRAKAEQNEMVSHDEQGDLPDTAKPASVKTTPPSGTVTADTFYTYGEAMMVILDFGNSPCSIWRKTAIHEAWAKLEAMGAKGDSEPNREPDELDPGKNVVQWAICADWEHGHEPRIKARAQKLVDLWEEEIRSGKEDQRWYEVSMQRSEPEGEDASTLKVDLEREGGPLDEAKEYAGTWWITGFKPADETHPALENFDDYVEYYY